MQISFFTRTHCTENDSTLTVYKSSQVFLTLSVCVLLFLFYSALNFSPLPSLLLYLPCLISTRGPLNTLWQPLGTLSLERLLDAFLGVLTLLMVWGYFCWEIELNQVIFLI